MDVAIKELFDTAARMLGLRGFRVLAVAEFDDELQVQVETHRGPGRVPVVRGGGRAPRPASAPVRDLPTIMRAVREFGQRILDAAWVDRAVTRLRVDETAFLAATAGAHIQFLTGLMDLARRAGAGPAARRGAGPLPGGGDRLVGRTGAQWCAGCRSRPRSVPQL